MCASKNLDGHLRRRGGGLRSVYAAQGSPCRISSAMVAAGGPMFLTRKSLTRLTQGVLVALMLSAGVLAQRGGGPGGAQNLPVEPLKFRYMGPPTGGRI